MADCPLVTPDGLDRLAGAARPIALAPAQDGGTNAIALCPADVIEPAFGMPHGARVVLERAREAGLRASSWRTSGSRWTSTHRRTRGG